MNLASRVRSVFRGRCESAGFPPTELWPDEIEHLADDLFREALAPRWGDPAALAWRLGERLVPSVIRGCGGEACAEGIIAYRHHPDARTRGGRIFHALAHRQIRKIGIGSESDVWILQGELVAPWRWASELSVEELAKKQKHAPTWLLAAQREHAIAFRWVEAV